VRELAETVMSRHNRLDVLVNNVGAMYARRQETTDGVEMTFAVNYLNLFLLTSLLLPLLKASAPARIINVNSGGHRMGKLNFDDLQSKQGYLALDAYGKAKLALALFTYELARRLEGSGVTANTADPGNAETDMTRNTTPEMLPPMMRLMWPLRPIFFRLAGTPTVEAAAKSSIYLASSPDVDGVNGKYFSPRLKQVRSSKESYDETMAERLWTVSEQLLNLQQLVTG
jgi:NAD(P)-dependent dehydrogenase (short-subunit alcohol dehydrogenase family)